MTPARRKKYYFFSFAAPVILLLVYFILRHIAPFGENTFLIHDMNAQYVDYFAYMRSVFSGGNNFVYTMSRELGGDFRSFYFYYLISPLNLIPILSPENLVPTAVSIEMLLLFGAAGLSAYYCFSVFSEDLDSRTRLYFSIAYSLSAWMVLNAENFQFIPEAAILPMVLVSLHKYRTEHIIFPVILWLTAAVVLNFYIGYMICLFVLIWMLVPDGNRFDPKYFLIFSAVGLLSAPVWISVIRTMGTTIKTIDSDWYIPQFNFMIPEFLKKFLPGQFDPSQYQDHGLPSVYCGMISLLAAIFYFFRGKFTSIKLHRLIILLVLFASFIFRPMTMIWHGFSEPHWWPYRFSFLFIFTVLLCASESRLKIPSLILLVGVGGLYFNMYRTFTVKTADCVTVGEYIESVQEKKTVIDSITSENDELFRIADTSPRSDNDAMHFGYAGITGFDSLADRSAMNFLKEIGYPQERYTVRYSLGNTEFADYLLGVRYKISGGVIQETVLPVSIAFLSDRPLESDLPETNDAIQMQNSLASDLGASGPVLTVISETEKRFDHMDCTEEFCWTLSAKEPGSIYYKFSVDKDGFLYAHVSMPLVVGNMTLISNAGRYELNHQDYFLPLGEIKKDMPLEVELKLRTPVSDVPNIEFIFEDSSSVLDLFSGSENTVSTEKITSSKMKFTLQRANRTRYLVITIPFDTGWKASSDNGALQIVPVWGVFPCVIIPSGVSEIILQYK